jgi:hypothetical protein
MIFVTLTLNDSEWERVRNVAQTYWPSEQLARQLSKNEACRRLLMGGITSLQSTSENNQKAMASTYARPIQPPGDNRMMPQWPGAHGRPMVDPQS